MKNLKKLALGLLVGAMAIGFSAFKSSADNNAKLAQEVFYSKTGIQSTNPTDYYYRADADCNLTPAAACSAIWNYTGTLSEDSHPNGSKVSTTDRVGTWDGN